MSSSCTRRAWCRRRESTRRAKSLVAAGRDEVARGEGGIRTRMPFSGQRSQRCVYPVPPRRRGAQERNRTSTTSRSLRSERSAFPVTPPERLSVELPRVELGRHAYQACKVMTGPSSSVVYCASGRSGLRAARPPSLRSRHSLRSAPCNDASKLVHRLGVEPSSRAYKAALPRPVAGGLVGGQGIEPCECGL